MEIYVFVEDLLDQTGVLAKITATLPETNSSPMKIPIFPGKYHQNGGFSSQLSVDGSEIQPKLTS